MGFSTPHIYIFHYKDTNGGWSDPLPVSNPVRDGFDERLASQVQLLGMILQTSDCLGSKLETRTDTQYFRFTSSTELLGMILYTLMIALVFHVVLNRIESSTVTRSGYDARYLAFSSHTELLGMIFHPLMIALVFPVGMNRMMSNTFARG